MTTLDKPAPAPSKHKTAATKVVSAAAIDVPPQTTKPLAKERDKRMSEFRQKAPVKTDFLVTNFTRVYKAPSEEIIDAIRDGVSARQFKSIASKMHAPMEQFYKSLGIPKSTVERKASIDGPLTTDQSERALGLARLIGQVENMVKESGDPADFDAATWVWNWLNQPMPALAGKLPVTYMDTIEGQRIVANLISMSQSGAYA